MAHARGFSVQRRDHRPGSLKGLAGPAGHCRLGGGVAAQTLVIVWHPVQDAFALLPTGTTYRGRPKYDSVGKGQRILPTVLAQASESSNVSGPVIPMPSGSRKVRAH